MSKNSRNNTLDKTVVKEIVDAFSYSTGVNCCVYAEDHSIFYLCCPKHDICSYRSAVFGEAGEAFRCDDNRCFAAEASSRFGGRYTYLCAMGLGFAVSPIVMNGKIAGSIACGPLMIIDEEDFADNKVFDQIDKDRDIYCEYMKAVSDIPKATPKYLDYLSSQLFANAVYISDSSVHLLERLAEDSQQNIIGTYISQLKTADEYVPYPIDKETDLFHAVAHKDRPASFRLLNELLGYIFFYTRSSSEIQARLVELITVLSRAAISGGGDTKKILDASRNLQKKITSRTTQGEIAPLLAKNLQSYMDLMYDTSDMRHGYLLLESIRYINDHYAQKLTLNEVASVSGYSPTYFSKIFKEETGDSFKEFLNKLRIEKSKSLLLSNSSSVSEISSVVGFSDQSYFCKTFKRYTGTTPESFRMSIRRVDHEKEHG